MSLISEIFEQPLVLGRLLKEHMEDVQEIAREIQDRDISYIFLAARGSSDNAGLYAKYLWGAYNQLPVALAAPSLVSVYGQPPDLRGALVLGISQSGQSPDIVCVLAEGRRQGAPTMAITNAPTSPLAQIADYAIDLHTGPERAVAATKTYTAQLMAIAMFSVAISRDQERLAELERVQTLVEQVLAQHEKIGDVVARYRSMQGCVVLGRGFNYATAFEWSLKLKELAYVMAEPYSSADFQHGPVALILKRFPVLAVVPSGAVYADMLGLLTRLVQEGQVTLLAISNEKEALELADTPISLPRELPEWLSPLVSIVPAQLISYHLARAKGIDTEHPRGLQKVTLTW